jgi:hypothetical protein
MVSQEGKEFSKKCRFRERPCRKEKTKASSGIPRLSEYEGFSEYIIAVLQQKPDI